MRKYFIKIGKKSPLLTPINFLRILNFLEDYSWDKEDIQDTIDHIKNGDTLGIFYLPNESVVSSNGLSGLSYCRNIDGEYADAWEGSGFNYYGDPIQSNTDWIQNEIKFGQLELIDLASILKIA